MRRSVPCSLSMGLMLAATGSPALGQTAEPRLQDAKIRGRGHTLAITHLPVVVDGKTSYRDVLIDLAVDADGRVSVALGHPIVSKPTPPTIYAHYTAGSYQAVDSANNLIRMTGEEDKSEPGVTRWTLSGLIPGAGTPLYSASFFTGPVDTNPRSRRLQNAGIESEAYSYGTSEGGYGSFETGALLGLRQTGDVLTIYSFSNGCCADRNVPTASMSFKYVGR